MATFLYDSDDNGTDSIFLNPPKNSGPIRNSDFDQKPLEIDFFPDFPKARNFDSPTFFNPNNFSPPSTTSTVQYQTSIQSHGPVPPQASSVPPPVNLRVQKDNFGSVFDKDNSWTNGHYTNNNNRYNSSYDDFPRFEESSGQFQQSGHNLSNSHLHSPNNGHGAPPTHSSNGARDSHSTHNSYPDYNGGIESRMVRNSNQNQSQPTPPAQPPSQDTFNLPPNAKSCRSQNLQYPDKCYTNQESANLLAELRNTIEENHLSKGVLKSKIFKLLSIMDKNLTLDDAVEFLVEIQGAFNRTDQQQICNDICHDKGVGQIVGMLVFHRHQLRNEQKLKVARSLLRVSWSLTFSTISDLVNALRPSHDTGLYTVDELELFCQCLHNFYLLENVEKNIINSMAETATQFMTSITANLNENPEENLQTLLYKLTIVYKCYGKRLNQNDKNIVCEAFETFANRGIMKGDNLFNDNRSCVVHVLDSLYRAESHLPRFTQVIENCVLELATRNVILTTQDISAVLRVFQRYRDTNSINFCLALQKVATAMNERITNGLNNEIKVRAKDFLKNMKILSSKYFVDKHLYENFCALVERDLKEDCKCTKKPCPKSCLMLDFCNLADVLDSISTVNYVYKDKNTHLYFLSRIAERLTETGIVQTFFSSPHRNKAQKLMYILQNFQIYGFYPEGFINDDQFNDLYREHGYFRSYFLIKQQEYKFGSYERLGIEYGSSKTGDAKLDYIFYNNAQKIETQAKNLLKMEERLREVLYEMNFETLKQSHSVCNNAVYFIINDETAVLPLARVKFCRDKTGTIDNLAGLSGKITPVYRMLKSQYRFVLQVPYYEFERDPGNEAEFIRDQLNLCMKNKIPDEQDYFEPRDSLGGHLDSPYSQWNDPYYNMMERGHYYDNRGYNQHRNPRTDSYYGSYHHDSYQSGYHHQQPQLRHQHHHHPHMSYNSGYH